MIFLLSSFLFLGGLLYGMYLLRFGLFNLSTNSLRKWLISLTNTYWKGILLGIFISVILQNGSIVMVITVGLVATRLLTFPESVGFILGANIGATLTIEIITIDLQSYFILLAFIGAILCFFNNRNSICMGYALIGLSLVFGAMWGFEMIAIPISELEYVRNLFLNSNHNSVFLILLGTVLTAIVQSINALSGIAMDMLAAGEIDLRTGVSLILGGNIGASATVLIAAIGSGKKARLTAFAYTWLNVLGVALFYPLIDILISVSTNFSSQPEIQLAHINIIFNVIVSLLVLLFANQFVRLIQKIHNQIK
ncbi:Na/Pi symporter [Virgibacillus litoralis]|uniref:Phosphate:Na+ symporter n=1 Tax=Virgibacillus litoralis TaxID=578221 RepID=A0ABS4HEF1_9BACI|nr:Na/Pi symporter [Virgibacillus litoralis]MBP1949314.1 phosphate:Na+ symporter [Virgibacillus litoralis]